MTRLFIVRHGNTFDRGDTVLRVGGRTDLPLSGSGEMQAGALGAHFAAMGLAPVRIIAGPLKRTLQTARVISGALGGPDIELDERLREIDYGPDEGKPEEDVVARIGREALEAWETRALVPEGWQVEPAGLIAMWDALISEASGAHGDTMVVTSNGIARFVPCLANAGKTVPLKLRTGAYGVIGLANGEARVIDWDLRP